MPCASAWPCSTTTRCSACHRPRRRPCCWSRYPLFGGGWRRRICFSSRFPEYLNHPRGAAALARRKRSLVWINLNFFRGCRPTYFSARLFFIICRRRCLQAFDKATLKFFFSSVGLFLSPPWPLLFRSTLQGRCSVVLLVSNCRLQFRSDVSLKIKAIARSHWFFQRKSVYLFFYPLKKWKFHGADASVSSEPGLRLFFIASPRRGLFVLKYSSRLIEEENVFLLARVLQIWKNYFEIYRLGYSDLFF